MSDDPTIKNLGIALAAAKAGDLCNLILVSEIKSGQSGERRVTLFGEPSAIAGLAGALHQHTAEAARRAMFPEKA